MPGRKISWTNIAVNICAVFQVINVLSVLLLLMAAGKVVMDPGAISSAYGEPVSVHLFGMDISLSDMLIYSSAGAASVPGVVVYLLIGCVRSGMHFLAFGNIRQVIGCSGSPFSRESVDKLRSAGGLFLGSVGLQLVYGLITMVFAFGSLSFSANLRFDNIVIGAMVLCVSEIFARGAELQEDQDGLV